LFAFSALQYATTPVFRRQIFSQARYLTGGTKMQKLQSRIQVTLQRLGAVGLLLLISLILLLSFFWLGRGQILTLRAAGEAQVRSLADAVDTKFLPIIFYNYDPNVRGNVFRDYNANGVQDVGEPGVPGITVSAYNANGIIVASTTTGAQGEYNLVLPGSEGYRLEFTGIPDYLQPGAVGDETEATVAFVSASSSDVNVGLNNPADYCQENPEVATPCYLFGDQDHPRAAERAAVVSFDYQAGSDKLALDSPDYTPPNEYDDAKATEDGIQEHPNEALAPDIGPANGLAFQRSENVIFAGAFMKRHSGFGPGGTGAIYRIERHDNPDPQNPVNNVISVYADLNDIFAQPNTPPVAGKDPHDSSHLSDPGDIDYFFLHDPSFDQVSKISLGDVEISEDEKFLYTVNLNDKMLYRIPVLNEPSPPFTPNDIDRFSMPTPSGCAAVDIRPFALAIQDGTLYAGITCSAQSTQLASDMHAYVYSFDGTSFDQQPALDFPLDYIRGCADRVPVGVPGCGIHKDNKEAEWNPWVGTLGELLEATGTDQVNTQQRRPVYPQPLLSDIEFANGYMIVGLRDRNGDLFGNGAFDPRDENNQPIGFTADQSSLTNTYLTVSSGDMLAAAPDPDRPGRWLLENNAAVGDLPPTDGANNGNGPGNGEYFFDESFAVVDPGDHPRHDETAQGGLTNIPGQIDALTTSLNPVPVDNPNNFFDGGIIWLSGADGTRSRSYRVFAGEQPGHDPDNFPNDVVQGKNNGLGDLEVFCDPAPLEIGDRVWFDANENGIQDPDEKPLAGVSVKLYAPDMTTLLATAITNAEGNYYFSNASSGPLSGSFAVYGVEGLKYNTSGYKLRIDMTQPAITDNNYVLTQANADGHTDNNNKTDLRDSDAITSGQNAEIMFDSGAAGHNNHTLDFGFIQPPELVAVGNRVWLDDGKDGGVAGDGIVNGSEMGIDGVEVQLYPGSGVSGTPIKTTITAANGCYLFDDLTPGDYIIHIPADQFVTGGPLQDLFSSLPEGGDTPDDDNVDENGQNTPVNGGISSTIINLVIGGEPTNEPSRSLCASTQPDANENMTVDFGFTPTIPPSVAVGNRVWLDDGSGGGTARDGIVNGTEMGIGGVEVQLYPGSGVSGTPIKTTTTRTDGCYLFDYLAPGKYITHIPADQFATGSPLQDLLSSLPEGGDTPDDDNVDENGQNTPVNGGISSTIINLVIDGEPTNEPSRSLCASTQPDANENMTVDFGFTPKVLTPVAVGNRVWLDNGAGNGTAGDGIVNGTEMGIGNVEVQLYPGSGVSGSPIETTATTATGCYLFDNLVEGNYIIHIPASQFTAGSPLHGLFSSLPEGGDTPDDDNVDENGQNTPVNGGISSTVINLMVGAEPIDEISRSLCASTQPDANENMTVDFGFTPPVPDIRIIKETNGQDGPQIQPGDPVTWTYEITNSGAVSFAKEDIEVTDSQGEIPLFDSELAGNGDDNLDPGEIWLYKAEGTAEEVGSSQGTIPTLWGVDEQRNELFSIDDYTEIPNGATTAGLTIYGPLYYTNQDGVTQDIGKHIGSFTIDTDNVAYVAYNKNLDPGGGLPLLKAPIMLRFALKDASTVENNIAEVIGSIPIPGFDINPAVDDNISGMSFDPSTGNLYALYRVTDGPAPDKLLLVSKEDASLIADLGEMRNDALGAVVEDGEAIEFDESGNLYISDNWDDHLYQVNPQTAEIMSIIDNDERGGLTDIGSQLKTEGLAWDPLTDTMVATDDREDIFYIQTLENGNNVTLGPLEGLLDVEAIDFLIPCYMNVGEVTATVTVGNVTSSVSDTDPSHYCN
jgi:uncharacterized protein YjiK